MGSTVQLPEAFVKRRRELRRRELEELARRPGEVERIGKHLREIEQQEEIATETFGEFLRKVTREDGVKRYVSKGLTEFGGKRFILGMPVGVEADDVPNTGIPLIGEYRWIGEYGFCDLRVHDEVHVNNEPHEGVYMEHYGVPESHRGEGHERRLLEIALAIGTAMNLPAGISRLRERGMMPPLQEILEEEPLTHHYRLYDGTGRGQVPYTIIDLER